MKKLFVLCLFAQKLKSDWKSH